MSPASQCRVGSATDDPCENPATVSLLPGGEPCWCEQHLVEHELVFELEEWQEARFHASQWADLAQHVGNPALKEVAMFARLECETRVDRIRGEIERVWED